MDAAAARDRRAIIWSKYQKGKGTYAIAKDLAMNQRSVANILKRIKARNSDISPRKSPGRPPTSTTSANIRKVKDMARHNTKRKMRQMTKTLNMSRTSVRNLVAKANLKSLKTISKPLLSAAAKEKRLARSQSLKTWLEANAAARRSRIVLYSDEKLFTVDPVVNRQNDRHLVKAGSDPAVRVVTKTKFPNCLVIAVIVFGLVASNRKTMPPLFLAQGAKVTATFYQEEVLSAVEQWAEATYGSRWRQKIVLQQDGAPAHTAKSTQDYLTQNWGEAAFWKKEMWPPSSPDLNPIDFWVWSAIEQVASKKRARSILRQKLSRRGTKS